MSGFRRCRSSSARKGSVPYSVLFEAIVLVPQSCRHLNACDEDAVQQSGTEYQQLEYTKTLRCSRCCRCLYTASLVHDLEGIVAVLAAAPVEPTEPVALVVVIEEEV